MERADRSARPARHAPTDPPGTDDGVAVVATPSRAAHPIRHWRHAAAVFLVVAAWYLATRPGNVSEAEDGFAYATVADLAHPTWAQTLLPDHVLFYPLIRSYLAVLHLTGWNGRAYDAVVTLDLVVGAAMVAGFYLLLVRRLAVAERAALVGALLLPGSYGPWRYAVEVEIPAWTSLAAVGLLYAALAPGRSTARAAALGIAAAASIAMHGLNALLATTAIPAWLLVRHGMRGAAAYALAAAGSLAGIVGGVLTLRGDLAREINRVAELSSVGAQFAKGLLGLAQAVVSGNFLFGSPRFAAFMTAAFPEKMLREEIFMGRHAPDWLFAASVATVVALGIAAVGLLAARVHLGRTAPAPRAAWVFVLWSVVYAAFAFGKNPGSFELWVPFLVPAWALVTIHVVAPLMRAGRAAACVAFAVCLLLHNSVGGFAWIHDRDGDYDRVRGAWLLAHATADDLVLTADTTEFSTYLHYWGPATVLDTYKLPDERLGAPLTDSLATWPGAVYVVDDVLAPPSCLCLVRAGFCERLAGVAAALRPLLEPMPATGDATVYRLRRTSAPPA